MSDFVPSLGYHFLTPFYDFLFRLLLPEKKIRSALLQFSTFKNPSLILEAGCGTGGLTIPLAEYFSQTTIDAIDKDDDALAILQSKINKKEIKNIHLQNSSSTMLPFDEGHFDAAYASLLFCNLSYDDKIKTIHELKRVLKDEGQLLIAEWSKPMTTLCKAGFTLLRLFDQPRHTDDLMENKLPQYLHSAGFTIDCRSQINTLAGTISFYRVMK